MRQIMNDLKQSKKRNENITVEQVCEIIRTARNSMIGDEGEFIVMGGMVTQELIGNMQKAQYGFDLVGKHFYAIVELPIGDSFAIKETDLQPGFHEIDEDGTWS